MTVYSSDFNRSSSVTSPSTHTDTSSIVEGISALQLHTQSPAHNVPGVASSFLSASGVPDTTSISNTNTTLTSQSSDDVYSKIKKMSEVISWIQSHVDQLQKDRKFGEVTIRPTDKYDLVPLLNELKEHCSKNLSQVSLEEFTSTIDKIYRLLGNLRWLSEAPKGAETKIALWNELKKLEKIVFPNTPKYNEFFEHETRKSTVRAISSTQNAEKKNPADVTSVICSVYSSSSALSAPNAASMSSTTTTPTAQSSDDDFSKIEKMPDAVRWIDSHLDQLQIACKFGEVTIRPVDRRDLVPPLMELKKHCSQPIPTENTRTRIKEIGYRTDLALFTSKIDKIYEVLGNWSWLSSEQKIALWNELKNLEMIFFPDVPQYKNYFEHEQRKP